MHHKGLDPLLKHIDVTKKSYSVVIYFRVFTSFAIQVKMRKIMYTLGRSIGKGLLKRFSENKSISRLGNRNFYKKLTSEFQVIKFDVKVLII